MKILGEPLFARDSNGMLKSRIGTLFLRTPGLVTQKGVHAMQRLAWIVELNKDRAAAGKPPLTDDEIATEMAESVDLLFSSDYVLIRPDPMAMDVALRGDEVLQTMVSKRKIRYLNTHAACVRDALRARGENWRMARTPQTSEELVKQIAAAQTAIACESVYYYNEATGTRYLTAGSFTQVVALPSERLRAQLSEIAHGIGARNRLGQPEVALFPTFLPRELTETFRTVRPLPADDGALRALAARLAEAFRAAIPEALRVESPDNFAWRNALCSTLSRRPNETDASDEELIQGISPEFYRQIEWLPGCRIEDGELIFDPIFDEAAKSGDPALNALCDRRARNLMFNCIRLSGTISYINIGRIVRSLARRPSDAQHRGTVYIVQYKEAGAETEKVRIIRFQKWGVAEHLDEGHDLVRSIIESDVYSDYILDRRLGCRQLGMNLPRHVNCGQIAETYLGSHPQFRGSPVWAVYYERAYIPGAATDKIPPSRFGNPVWTHRFAEFMGEAAAIDLVVGRVGEDGAVIFDSNYEVVQTGPDGLPVRLVVTDQAGTFKDYQRPFDESVVGYARVVNRRVRFVHAPAAFADTYVAAFQKGLAFVQARYRARRRAFDTLFSHRPVDTGGSGAYRWQCILKRLDACDPAALAAKLRAAIILDPPTAAPAK